MIQLVNFTKLYYKKIVLSKVTIDFPKHGVVGLLGKNGSGKTTLLNIIAGLRTQTKGYLNINEKKVENRNQFDEVAITPERQDVYDYTIVDLVKLYTSFYKDFDHQKCLQIIKEGQIDEFESFSSLSKGQQTYVILALTISRDVKIYLLDEPFSGLDVMVRKEITNKIINYIDLDEKLIVLSSHDIDHLERLFDSIMTLKDHTLTHYTMDEITKYESLKDFYKAVIIDKEL